MMDVENQGSSSQSSQTIEKDNPPPAPNVWNLWSNLPTYDPGLQYLENGKMKLAQLDVKAKSNTRIPYAKVEDFFDKIGDAIDGLVQNGSNSFSLFLTAEKLRDHLHGKTAQIGGVPFKMQSYPPPRSEAPHFKERPEGITTHMRLQSIPMDQPLQVFEDALMEYFPKYVKESASFETSSRKRKTRNGKITFFLEGVVYGIPGKYLKIQDSTVALENHSNPLPLPNTPTWVPTIAQARAVLEKMEQKKTGSMEQEQKGAQSNPNPNPINPPNTTQHTAEESQDPSHSRQTESPSRSRSTSPSKRNREDRDFNETGLNQEIWTTVTYKKRKNHRSGSGSEAGGESDSETGEKKFKDPKGKGKIVYPPNKNVDTGNNKPRNSERIQQKNTNPNKEENSQTKQNTGKEAKTKNPAQTNTKDTPTQPKKPKDPTKAQRNPKSQHFNPALNIRVDADHHYSPDELEASQQSIYTYFYKE